MKINRFYRIVLNTMSLFCWLSTNSFFRSFSHWRHNTKEKLVHISVLTQLVSGLTMKQPEVSLASASCWGTAGAGGAILLIKLSRLWAGYELERMTENSKSGFSLRSVPNKLVAQPCPAASTAHLEFEKIFTLCHSSLLSPHSYIFMVKWT